MSPSRHVQVIPAAGMKMAQGMVRSRDTRSIAP
jgi:hypothetical protein